MIYIDATAGVAGDMLLGALVDLGVDTAALQTAIDAVVPRSVLLRSATATRAGQRAAKVNVEVISEDVPFRYWSDIQDMLRDAPLHPQTRAAALGVFDLIAQAEGRAHGLPPERIHFHEVGALDSIADIVGVCEGFRLLGGAAAHVTASPVTLGFGRIAAAHGDMPVPVPAVAELAIGCPTQPGIIEGEQTTPTGLALVRYLADDFGHVPAGIMRGIGVGAGTKDSPEQPNVVRLIQLDDARAGRLLQVEANVDDMDPRVWPSVLDALLAAGAKDAWLTGILMKKGRPAHTIHVLTDDLEATKHVLFTHTTTLGARSWPVDREELDRRFRAIDISGHRVALKEGLRDGVVVNRKAEFSDVSRVAQDLGLPVLDVLERAQQAPRPSDPSS